MSRVLGQILAPDFKQSTAFCVRFAAGRAFRRGLQTVVPAAKPEQNYS
jgi:hypothetical protein